MKKLELKINEIGRHAEEYIAIQSKKYFMIKD